MSKFIKFLNSEEEWLPVNACMFNDNNCKSDDGCGGDDACSSDDLIII